MLSIRRQLLDRALERSLPLFKGDVMDVGGRKKNPRGLFRPPLQQVKSWTTINPDLNTEPDRIGHAEDATLPVSSVDVVLCTEVLEYLRDPKRALGNLFRILRTKGVLLLSVPFLNPVHGDSKDDRVRFTRAGLQEKLEEAGFENVKIEPMGSLGAVVYDLILASLQDHSKPRVSALSLKIARRLLLGSRWLFLAWDRLVPSRSEWITTGYFAIGYRTE